MRTASELFSSHNAASNKLCLLGSYPAECLDTATAENPKFTVAQLPLLKQWADKARLAPACPSNSSTSKVR